MNIAPTAPLVDLVGSAQLTETPLQNQATLPDIRLLRCRVNSYAPSQQIDRAQSSAHTIELVASGTGVITRYGEHKQVSSGSLIYGAPETQHSLNCEGSQKLKTYHIEIDGTEVSSLLRESPFYEGFVHDLASFNWVRETFANLIECQENHPKSANTLCELLLKYFFTRLNSSNSREEESSSRSSWVFEKCRSYIERKHTEINSAHEIAKACNISHPYLCNLFKRFSDETPTHMLQRLKLNQSIAMLKRGEMLIKEIAREVGFEDQYYFSRCFKSHFGVSPRDYIASAQLQSLSA